MRHPDTHKGGRPLPPLGLTEQEEEVVYPEAKNSWRDRVTARHKASKQEGGKKKYLFSLLQ